MPDSRVLVPEGWRIFASLDFFFHFANFRQGRCVDRLAAALADHESQSRGHLLVKAVSYLRTSSAANVGADKDSDQRQRAAIAAFCKRSGFEIVDEFYDPAVSGTDPIETRPGFSALLDRIESNGVRTVIVEDPTRFARELITQELGIVALVARGVTVLTASGDDLTNTTDPFKVAMRQIAGAGAVP